MTYFVGIDVSTTATKALLMAADGKLLGVAASEYTYESPKPLWTEQHPNLWWQATVASMAAAPIASRAAAQDHPAGDRLRDRKPAGIYSFS